MKTRDKVGIVGSVIRHKKIVYIILAALIVIGAFGLVYMNKDEFPTFEIKQGLVVGVYPGATASEVEEQLTKPLEELLFSFSEVNRNATYSYSKDGICYIYVDLVSPASKKTEVWSKIKLKLDVAKATFPPGVLAVAVMDDFSSVSALLIAMESDDKGYSEMKEYADRLCSRLRTIPELANVKVVGAQDEEIAVTLDMEKLSAYGISSSSLMLNYQTSGLLTMGGTFKTDYINAPIYIANPVSTEKEIADHIVYSDPAGNIVRLSDIATVERRCKEADSKVNYNGNSALILSVEMRPGNNIVEFGQKVDDMLVDFSHELPDRVTMSRITDQPKVVSTSVMSFLRDLVISMLVVIAVMLMLFPLRSALIASSGVPVCTAVAIAIMYVTGIDLNTVTLAALIVVLGMIVDDSIITMDGYMDNLGKGMSRIDAATASANELFMPMFMATAAISVMFFPIKGIITGYLGDFVSLFPWVIAIALGTSLAYAMLVVPSLEVRFIGGSQNSKANLFSRIQKKFFDGMQNGYEKIQAVCFRHPKLTILCGLAAVALGILMFLQLNVQMMPMAARDMFAVEIYLESNSGLEQTEAVADSLQDMLLKDKRVKSVTAFIGTGAPRFNATYAPVIPSRNFAQLVVNTESTKATEALLKEYQERYADIFPEALLRFKQMDYQAVSCPVSVELRGGSHEEMRPFADSIRNFMYGMDDMLQWVHSDCDNFITSVKVNLDPEEAARTGVNRTMLSLYMAGAFNGQPIASLWDGEDKIPVNLYNGALTDSMSYSTISNQTVPTSMPGISVPLRQIASIEPQVTPETYARKAGQEQITVCADLKCGKSHPAAMKEISGYVETHIMPHLPDGVSVHYGGLSSTNETVGPEIMLSFFCAVSILFLFLMFHFKKLSIALLTLILSTLCLFGAFFGLWLFRLDFSITAVLGLISLVGIIVRNGIIMFEYAEELRFAKGFDVRIAAEEAGKRRMRPIFLTSCTTALGVLPMIISADALWMPMGVVICFGTLLSILLIVLIMPISYWQIFKNVKTKEAKHE